MMRSKDSCKMLICDKINQQQYITDWTDVHTDIRKYVHLDGHTDIWTDPNCIGSKILYTEKPNFCR